ncbi:Uncharacterised protein [Sphingobacterium mizutaii]|uniref:Uncharacterized protein n=1 Tax=Sphingobacterium mizutaii TaxID=1010 RepID=A0AAJ5C0K3_9SPHI|nr:hypothetical protein SAMN05192578_1011286 [Sphingobacterium mizutaii]SNV51455.1 Uncharacterised protein [Sphingobacterium mizutaii]
MAKNTVLTNLSSVGTKNLGTMQNPIENIMHCIGARFFYLQLIYIGVQFLYLRYSMTGPLGRGTVQILHCSFRIKMR